MNHLPVLPILLPLITGALLVTLPRLGLNAQRFISLGATVAGLGLVLWLGSMVLEHGRLVYALGGWAPPFGIVLVPGKDDRARPPAKDPLLTHSDANRRYDRPIGRRRPAGRLGHR